MTQATLQRITLHLARSHEFPQGSARHGYDLIAPLDAEGRLNADLWKQRREECEVIRFWGAEDQRIGRLIHRGGGAGGATWVIDYNPVRHDDDEAGFKLGQHHFIEGEYVSIADEGGEMHTFRIARVEPAE